MSAIILACHRPRVLQAVLEQLQAAPVDEIIIVDNGGDLPADLAVNSPPVRVIAPGRNLGAPGRNLAAREAHGDLLLMLDDDSYPYPGTVERMVAALAADPRLGVLGGPVIDVDPTGMEVTTGREPGTFDWFLRSGAGPGDTVAAYFFPEGGSMLRRSAFLEAGGCFEPYFMMMTELDLATRLIAAGWGVRYMPDARFGHLRHTELRLDPELMLRYRIRNQLWYFWLRFPAAIAARRILAYLAFDLLEAFYRGMVRGWAGAVRDAVAERGALQGLRRPLPRELVPRAELDRGRRHRQLVALGLARQVRRLMGVRPVQLKGEAPHRPAARR